MIALLVGMALIQNPGTIERDSFGVPRITAPDKLGAYRLMGQAVAEDRLWQMELSRRSARGQLSEILGSDSFASDAAVLQAGYTDAELGEMFGLLPSNVRSQWQAYVDGVNESIRQRTESNSLPPGYKELDFKPRPWTILDSAAIAVQLSRRFGQGGAGELRNYALIQYLRTRPAVKDRILDVLDDLAWQNDLRAPTTVSRADDPTLREPRIFQFSRQDSEAQLAGLPNTNLLELARGLRLALQEDLIAQAQALAVPYKVGSYAIVVAPHASATKAPLLLSAPQMGHTNPSVVHEVCLNAPDIKVVGMDVPGIPGVIIGHTPNAAWGLTSGVADLEDVFVSRLNPDGTYQHQGESRPFESIKFTVKVKGEPDREVLQLRTGHGPVLLKSDSSKAVYSLKSAYWKRELAAMAVIDRFADAKSPADFTEIAQGVPVSFNLFFATRQGDIGYRYCGAMPIRAVGVDPRMPTPDEARFRWQGFVSASDMPRVDNPASGFIVNWNNKPVSWWPNGDTPVWGQFFRSTEIANALPEKAISAFYLERAAWTIARRETDTSLAFMPWIKQAVAAMPPDEASNPLIIELAAFDGWNVDGSIGATLYARTVDEIRRSIFADDLGNFTSDSLFKTVIQPTVIADALARKTKIAYFAEDPVALVQKAIREVVAGPASPFVPGSIRIGGGSPIPYINRGTTIQITELLANPRGRSIASPGTAELGPHSTDQIDLARAWMYKPMWDWQP